MAKSRPINAALIVAAGRGARVNNGEGPKQYQILGDRTVLAHTLSAFLDHPDIDKIVVALHADDGDLYRAAVPEHPKLLAPVVGGATRQESVFAGLKATSEVSPEHVLIHDAARPFISSELISRICGSLEENVQFVFIKKINTFIVTDSPLQIVFITNQYENALFQHTLSCFFKPMRNILERLFAF